MSTELLKVNNFHISYSAITFSATVTSLYICPRDEKKLDSVLFVASKNHQYINLLPCLSRQDA
jgi:hypothetical protein